MSGGNRISTKFTGIKRRWLFNSLGLVLIIVLFAILAFTIVLSNYYYDSVRTNLESRAAASAGFFSKYINKSANEFYKSSQRFADEFNERDSLELQFINVYGRIQVSTTGMTVGYVPASDDIKRVLETGQLSSWVGTDSLTGERILSVSAPLMYGADNIVGVMRYVTSLREVDYRLLINTVIALAIGLFLVLLVAFSNLYFIRSILLPVQEVGEIAKKIASGSYGVRIEKEYGSDEIGQLVDTINHMSTEISAVERIKTDFMSSVSHELRTPLTAISGWCETLLATEFSTENEDSKMMRRGLRIMLKESERLTKMVEELLEFTRMEGGRLTLRVKDFSIADECEEICLLYKERLERDGIDLTYKITSDIPEITGDPERLRQVLLNLIDNAVKHGGEGKRVDLTVGYADNEVIVKVQDYGQGVPTEELPHIKYKFYKGSSKARGSGIGLAVADEIIRLHDGKLEIESEEGYGTVVRVYLPVKIGMVD